MNDVFGMLEGVKFDGILDGVFGICVYLVNYTAFFIFGIECLVFGMVDLLFSVFGI